MTPKTKVQIELARVNRKIPGLYAWQKKKIIEELLPHRGYRLKHTESCFSCGATWERKEAKRCPKCHRKLEYLETKERHYRDKAYTFMFHAFKEYQVFRYFIVIVVSKIGDKAVEHYHIQEIVRHIVSPKGDHVVYSVPVNDMGRWGINEGWSMWGDLQLRGDNDSYYISNKDMKQLFEPEYIPEVYRNGFAGDFHKFNPVYFIRSILKYTAAETLLKAGEDKLLEYCLDKNIKLDKYWPAIKIALRHSYKFKDMSLWFDYISFLIYLKKDLHNMELICPKNLNVAHDKYMALRDSAERKRQERLDRTHREREIERRKQLVIDYAKRMEKFMHISITDGVIEIKPIMTLDDFMEEGQVLGHCIYTNAYYNKEDSLILSARTGNTRLETIEFNLKKRIVEQCRGLRNQSTKDHDRILKLLNENINKIVAA